MAGRIGSRLARGLRRRLDRWTLVPERRPLFVLGTQKSGTSAIAHLLADRCGLSKTIDIPELWPPAADGVLRGRVPLATLVARTPRPFTRKLVKEPYLTLLFDQLDVLFPEARYVFVVRDPRDTLRSVLDRVDVPGDRARLGDLAERIPASWSAVFDPALCGLGPTAHYLDVLAERWRQAVQVCLDHAERVHRVRYEDFVVDKAGVIDALANSLELPVRNDVAQRVDHPFQPAGARRGEPWVRFFGAANLARIEGRCARPMAAHGYAPAVGAANLPAAIGPDRGLAAPAP